MSGLIATLALTAGLTAAPASAEPADTYVALGDSYAAGQGASPYLDACFRSVQSYAAELNEAPSVELLENKACSGATTSIVRDTQLGSLNKNVDLVTVTAGGNDLDAIGALVTCSQDPGAACTNALAQRAILLQQARSNPDGSKLFQDLLGMLRDIKVKAPHADIYVTGYPMLFDSAAGETFQSINALTLQLNEVIASAVTTAASEKTKGTSRDRLHYVDVAQAFSGHGIGSTAPWIVSLPPLCSTACGTIAEIFHPTAIGYSEGYAASITAALTR
jgi:hypothetical protein